jgi:hypothetical protein
MAMGVLEGALDPSQILEVVVMDASNGAVRSSEISMSLRAKAILATVVQGAQAARAPNRLKPMS